MDVMRLILLAFGVAALSGCSAFGLGGGLEIEAQPPVLVLEDTAGRTVYYVAFAELGALAFDLNPNVEEWPSIARGETLSIPYEDLDGYDEGDETATVYWSTGGGSQWESVRL